MSMSLCVRAWGWGGEWLGLGATTPFACVETRRRANPNVPYRTVLPAGPGFSTVCIFLQDLEEQKRTKYKINVPYTVCIIYRMHHICIIYVSYVSYTVCIVPYASYDTVGLPYEYSYGYCTVR